MLRGDKGTKGKQTTARDAGMTDMASSTAISADRFGFAKKQDDQPSSSGDKGLSGSQQVADNVN